MHFSFSITGKIAEPTSTLIPHDCDTRLALPGHWAPCQLRHPVTLQTETHRSTRARPPVMAISKQRVRGSSRQEEAALRGLTTRDLINIGVFTVLYFAAVAVCGQLGALVPILQVLGPLYIPIVAGIPFILFLTRVNKFGMITIMGMLVGLLVLATGQAFWVPLLALVLAPLADFVAGRGSYRRWPNLVAGYSIFSLMLIGTVVPLFFARDAYLARVSDRKDATWVQQIVDLTPMWMFGVMLLMLVIGSVIGAHLGRRVLRKHFERAGIA